jgi:hypothetical protein
MIANTERLKTAGEHGPVTDISIMDQITRCPVGSNDRKRMSGIWKQSADPAQRPPVRGQEWQPGWFAPTQDNDLLPKHYDFCFQRRSRPEQIDD